MMCEFYRNGVLNCSFTGNVCQQREMGKCATDGVITNGERIRRMTDMELMDLMDGDCPVSRGRVLPQCMAEDDGASCDACMLAWLAEPAEDGDGTKAGT